MRGRYVTDKQPLCQYCGKPIGKHTVVCFVEKEEQPYHQATSFSRHVYGDLFSKADCQRHTNNEVVSVAYWNADDDGKRRVCRFSTWDGRSYKDEYFCSGPCVERYAYTMADYRKQKGGA